jgi:hypothetical protein
MVARADSLKAARPTRARCQFRGREVVRYFVNCPLMEAVTRAGCRQFVWNFVVVVRS